MAAGRYTATTADTATLEGDSSRRAPARPALEILWCREEPWRVGEVALLPRARGQRSLIGRGPAQPGDAEGRAGWTRQRPGENQPAEPLGASSLSRAQLVVGHEDAGLFVKNVGRRQLSVDGAPFDEGLVRPGSVIEVENELMLWVTRRPLVLDAAEAWQARAASHAFGTADALGIVGESPEAWALRESLAFAAGRSHHVLILGETGTGKELAARAIHALSIAADRPLVARNAATLPEGLVEAELFGNAKNYPSAGMPARDGLIGRADGSTLLLDELGELPEAQQARLLRVLDSGGEYQKLGEDDARTSAFRLVGATNRAVDRIKHDLLARLTLRIELPPLRERRGDIPLIAGHLMLLERETDPTVERFVQETGHGPYVRFAPSLVQALMMHPLTSGIRELRALLWESVRETASGEWIEPSASLLQAARRPTSEHEHVSSDDLDEPTVLAALERHEWVISRAYRDLGLANRFVLHRLMKKLGIERPDA